MSGFQNKRRNQLRLARLEIVAVLYKRGKSYRAIREEVMRRLALRTYSLGSVKNDIDFLLKEWREFRLSNMDDLVQLELERIDDAFSECMEQWELSKEDYESQVTTKKATKDGSIKGDKRSQIETRTAAVRGLGNPAFIAEARAQLVERRKLLGLYSPERAVIKTENEMSREDIEAELARLAALQK